MSPQAMQQCIQDYFSALSNKDCDAWLATFANDGANHDPAGSPPNSGHAVLRQYFLTVSASFASMEIAADEFLLQGHRAAVTWNAQAVGHNDRIVKFSGIDVFEMSAAGTIQSLWGFWDPAAMFAELNA